MKRSTFSSSDRRPASVSWCSFGRRLAMATNVSSLARSSSRAWRAASRVETDFGVACGGIRTTSSLMPQGYHRRLSRGTSMATPHETKSMAVFCDFENVALGVREAKYDRFDIARVLERLLLKGSIVVKKAYCDWERYKEFKAPMHSASFELIEIPHIRQSGKNSADIRMVVDALDLCYTKSHVDAFVIVSGDSDFSPLVSKLRENNKTVIGVGVKKSTSDLLVS